MRLFSFYYMNAWFHPNCFSTMVCKYSIFSKNKASPFTNKVTILPLEVRNHFKVGSSKSLWFNSCKAVSNVIENKSLMRPGLQCEFKPPGIVPSFPLSTEELISHKHNYLQEVTCQSPVISCFLFMWVLVHFLLQCMRGTE